MTEPQWADANRASAAKVPRVEPWLAVTVLLAAVGLLLAARDSLRLWPAYWVNFLFWAGLAQAGVVLAAVVHLAQGRWGGALVRLGLLQVAFVPVTVILYLGIAFGAEHLLPWAKQPVAGKEWWLNLAFFLWRDGLGLVALTAASLAFAYFVLRPEAGAAPGLYPAWLTRGWRGKDAERERSSRVLSWLAPVLVILYAFVYSLIGFDMVMSLDPHWYSTLFGAYYFTTALYMGLAMLAVAAAVLRRPLGLEAAITSKQFHDLGKLIFAFCLLSGDFFWSQFLVIWYGDLPEEVSFIVHRVQHEPWRSLTFAVLFGGFVVPFVILINRRVKQIPWTLAAVSVLILAGGFAERVLMVFPSLHCPFRVGLAEALVTLGFAALYGLSLFWALRRFPLIPTDNG